MENSGSNTHCKSKREILKDKVVALVKDFVRTEGGLTQNDLKNLFGEWPLQEVAAALAELPISVS